MGIHYQGTRHSVMRSREEAVLMSERIFAGKYRTVSELGADVTGRTYLATGPDGEEVVVKVVQPADQVALDAVENDVSTVAGIRDPVLPQIHEWGHDGAEFFVVREYVHGTDLKTELGVQGRFMPVAVARYGAQAAGALEQIHRRGVVHGNVKTANLLRTPEDELKLVGYGLGPRGGAVAADVSGAAASAYYLAPEQVRGEAPTPRTDIYSLGIVLYELATGRVPFDGASAASVADQHVHAEPAPVRQLAPDVPAALESVIMRALEKLPEDRYATAEEMKADLERFLAPPEAPATAAPAARKRGRGWMWLLLAAVLLALVLGAAWALGLFAGLGKIAVPDVRVKSVTDATAVLEGAGLVVGQVTFGGASVAGVPDGAVSAQSPVAGTKVTSGAKVDLVLAGAEMIDVPDVIGQSEAEARLALAAAGFTAGPVTKESSAGVDPGTVLEQSPAAGLKAAKGSSVALRLAQAPSAVPDVTSRTQADAVTALESAGFAVKVVLQSSPTVGAGTVISQNPSGGVSAKAGSTVTIVVSTGPQTAEVPSVTTKTQADAVNMLTAAGFKTQVELQTGGGPVGTVADQSPEAGTKAAVGSTVVITVIQ
jgi:eukaryotic-like serine/threonine-protein kinase